MTRTPEQQSNTPSQEQETRRTFGLKTMFIVVSGVCGTAFGIRKLIDSSPYPSEQFRADVFQMDPTGSVSVNEAEGFEGTGLWMNNATPTQLQTLVQKYPADIRKITTLLLHDPASSQALFAEVARFSAMEKLILQQTDSIHPSHMSPLANHPTLDHLYLEPSQQRPPVAAFEAALPRPQISETSYHFP